MTKNPDILRRLHEYYHRVENDEVVKSIFNSGKNKEEEGIKIPEWMLAEEIKLTTHYQMTHSAPKTPNPATTEGESIAPRKPTVISIPIQISFEDLENQQNVEKVQEHLVDEEIEQLLEGNENVDTDEFMDEIFYCQEDPGTRLEPRSDKESPEVKKSADVLIIHDDDDEEEELAGDALIRRKQEKGKGIEEIMDSPLPTPIRSLRTHIAPISSDKETLQELTVYSQDAHSSSDKDKLKELIVDSFLRNCMSNNILHVHPTQAPTSSAQDLQYQLYLMLKDDEQLHHEDHHDDDAHPKGESSTKRQKTSEHGTYSVGESLSKQVMDQEPNPSGSGTQEQIDEFDAWMDNFGTYDDEVPTKEVSQELWEEISGEIDEAQLSSLSQLSKISKGSTNDFAKSRLILSEVWKLSTKEVYLSLHKYPAVPFQKMILKNELQDGWQKKQRDKPKEVYSESKIVEVIRTSYELGHEHKFITKIVVRRANGKIDPIIELDYIHLNKNDTKDLYLLCINGKVKDYRETGLLGSLTVFIKSCVIWERGHDFQLGMESYQQKVNLTAPTIIFPGIERKNCCLSLQNH
ncbi:hypothetical protein Tco_0710862 [Tanacetum coccineum]